MLPEGIKYKFYLGVSEQRNRSLSLKVQLQCYYGIIDSFMHPKQSVQRFEGHKRTMQIQVLCLKVDGTSIGKNWQGFINFSIFAF